MIDPTTSGAPKPKLVGNLAFVKEVAKYFMDFLETDFHKRKTPKRAIKLRNSDNLLVGLNVSKYPSFNREVSNLLKRAFKSDTPLVISKGTYRLALPENLLDLIELQVGKLRPSLITDVVSAIGEQVEKSATLFRKEQDKALAEALEFSSLTIKNKLVLPFVGSIEKPVESLGLGDENDLFLIEEELTEVLGKVVESKISDLITRHIAGSSANSVKELKAILTLESVKGSISTYFQGVEVGDLFGELFEMGRNKVILDKQDLYLYFGDITFNKIKYPIFYIPLAAEQAGDAFTITFDSQLYINKRALEYVVQEYNAQTGTRGTLKRVSDRIIYLSQHHDDLSEFLNAVFSDIVNLFDLDQTIDVRNGKAQVSRSLLVRASNAAYISLFDKSDEALVNDYEEILQELNAENGELAHLFNVLIDDFIHNNPVSFNPEVEDEWDETGTADRLVFDSPIPLNSEQIQILSAIRKNACKYIIVEGPPGTGKSHTITAISFDAILRHQSVLILSDKKEALDVVEDKITETMDKVRFGDEPFQNPILRLGKIGNTYNQILAKPTLNRIKAQQRVVKKDFARLEVMPFGNTVTFF